MRRYLARRLVRVLVIGALVVVAVVTLTVFAANETLAEYERSGFATTSPQNDPRFLTSLWPEDAEGEGFLMIPAVVLSIFAFGAGASMIGSEWRARTMTTVLTWEPRRTMLLVAKVLAAGILAFTIGALLTALFAAAFLPTVLAKGTAAGADAAWWANAVGGWLRIAALTGLTATVGAAMAALGRSTSAAIAVGFGWLLVGEALVRLLQPAWSRWLLSENVGTFLTGGSISTFEFTRTGLQAGLTLATYAAVSIAAAVVAFRRRDVAET